jgi:hypothetical protein
VLFPKQNLVDDFVGYIYVTFNVDEGLFYIGKQTRKDWCDSYYGGGKFPKQWLKEGKKLEHWPIQWCFIKEEINAEDKYTEIKFISLCVDKEEYNKLNQLILLDDNKRSLSELTAAFNIYYENTIIILKLKNNY